MIIEFLKRKNISKSGEIADYLEKNEIYLTHSMMINFVELAYELENSTDELFYEKLSDIKPDMKKSRKDRGAELLEEIKKMKMPVYFDTLREFEKRVRKIKDRQISIKYPRELEGEEIFLEIKLKNSKDVEKSLNSLNKNRKIIEEMMNIFENGIWEE
jgi:hypothetical protein